MSASEAKGSFGLIASYARPGVNVTGLVDHSFAALHLKRLELLKSVAPKARRVAWLQGDFEGLDAAQAAVRRKEIEAGEEALGGRDASLVAPVSWRVETDLVRTCGMTCIKVPRAVGVPE